MSAYLCARCEVDLRPAWFGEDRKCMFREDGTARAENWNCATVQALLELPGVGMFHAGDYRLEVVPGAVGPDDEGDRQSGWIVLVRYKRRGRTDMAWLVLPDGARDLTLDVAEATLAAVGRP